MNFLKITAIAFLFISGFLYAQKGKSNLSSHHDSSKVKLKLKGTVLPNNEFLHQKFVVPPGLLGNNILLNSNFDIYLNSLSSTNYSHQQDKLAIAKNNISNFLTLKYNSFPKYDLGRFGKYLGISKNIFAIILAIISML